MLLQVMFLLEFGFVMDTRIIEILTQINPFAMTKKSGNMSKIL